MSTREANAHLFLGQTSSLCETCLDLVPTKILREGDDIWYLKRCPTHGAQRTLNEDDLWDLVFFVRSLSSHAAGSSGKVNPAAM